MNVRVNAASRDDHAFAADDFSSRSNDDVHTRLCIGVASFANSSNASVFESNVRFDNAPVVQNKCIGQHGVHGALSSGAL